MTEQEMCHIFSTNLNSLLERKGLKQADIVRALSVSKGTVSGWCSGTNIPRTDTLSALTAYLNVELSDLLCKPDQKEKAPAEAEALVNGDPELTEYLEELRTRDEMRMLFSITKGATKEDVMRTVAIIEALRREEEGR